MQTKAKKRAIGLVLALLSTCMLFSSCMTARLSPFSPMEEPFHPGTLSSPGRLWPKDLPVPAVEEFRGVWIASVSNIDFPSRAGLSDAALASELDRIVLTCVRAGLNTIFFQVRPSSDALYHSSIFPLSAYLTGEQRMARQDDFDPLEYLIRAAHAAGIAVHAWINPVRISSGSAANPNQDLSRLAPENPARLHPEYVVNYGGGMYYDLGLPEVRELIADGVREIVENYAVDGVVFDDYFYPYPQAGVSNAFDDTVSYERYGNDREIGAFRRTNVNALVSLCYRTVKKANADVLFGVSPFGIWQNASEDARGSATAGLNAYTAIYCDATAWADGGYVDYIAPQLYWTGTNAAASYDVLCAWWAERLRGTSCRFVVSHGAYRYDEWPSPAGEMTRQVSLAAKYENYYGSVFYGYDEIYRNLHGITDELRAMYGGK